MLGTTSGSLPPDAVAASSSRDVSAWPAPPVESAIFPTESAMLRIGVPKSGRSTKHGDDQEDTHHDHQDIGLARLGEIERQMMRRQRVKLLVQSTLL